MVAAQNSGEKSRGLLRHIGGVSVLAFSRRSLRLPISLAPLPGEMIRLRSDILQQGWGEHSEAHQTDIRRIPRRFEGFSVPLQRAAMKIDRGRGGHSRAERCALRSTTSRDRAAVAPTTQ